MGSVESGLNEGRGFHQAQASIDNTTSTNFPQKCFCEFTLITSFIFVLLAGLNLTTASLFEEQVNHEELGKLQFNFNLAVLLGLLMLVYPIAGLVLNCRNKLPGKYILCLTANISIAFIGFAISISGSSSVKLPEVVDVKHEKLSDC